MTKISIELIIRWMAGRAGREDVKAIRDDLARGEQSLVAAFFRSSGKTGAKSALTVTAKPLLDSASSLKKDHFAVPDEQPDFHAEPITELEQRIFNAMIPSMVDRPVVFPSQLTYNQGKAEERLLSERGPQPPESSFLIRVAPEKRPGRQEVPPHKPRGKNLPRTGPVTKASPPAREALRPASKHRKAACCFISAAAVVLFALWGMLDQLRNADDSRDHKLLASKGPADQKIGASHPSTRKSVQEEKKDTVATNPSQTPAPYPSPPVPPVGPTDEAKERLHTAIAALNQEYGPRNPLPVADPRVQETYAIGDKYQKAHPGVSDAVISAFMVRAALTPENQVAYLAFEAERMKDQPPDSPGVRDLRKSALRLRWEGKRSFDLVVHNAILSTFLLQTKPTGANEVRDEKVLQVVTLRKTIASLTPDTAPAARHRLLFCVLPPGMWDEATKLYEDVQQFEREHPDIEDEELRAFLLQARRPTKADELGLLVPAYFPADSTDWQTLYKAADTKVPVTAIVDFGVNTGRIEAPKYTNRKPRLTVAKSHGIRVIGFINCNTASDGTGKLKAVSKVKQEINDWLDFYAELDGFFFYNQPSDEDNETVNKFKEMFEYARQSRPGCLIVSCSLEDYSEAYIKTIPDVKLCRFSALDAADLGPPAWASKYDRGQFAALSFGLGGEDFDEASPADYIQKASENHLGWIFVTNHRDWNPKGWHDLPKKDFWEAEVNTIAEIDRSIRGTIPPAPEK